MAEEVRRLALGEPKNTLSTLSWHDLWDMRWRTASVVIKKYLFQMLVMTRQVSWWCWGLPGTSLVRTQTWRKVTSCLAWSRFRTVSSWRQVIISAGFDDTIPDENGPECCPSS